MISIGVIAIGFLCVIGFLLLGLHVGTVMAVTALIGVLYAVGPMLLNSIGNLLWGQMNSFVLTAIPLYILMGEILVNSQIAGRMHRSLSDWVQWLRASFCIPTSRPPRCSRRSRGVLWRRPRPSAPWRSDVSRTGLQRTLGRRIHRERGDAGDPDPALDQPHHLWVDHRHLDRGAVHCGHHSRPDARELLHHHHRDRCHHLARHRRRRQRARCGPRRSLGTAGRSGGAGRDLRADHREHLWRLGDPDGGCGRAVMAALALAAYYRKLTVAMLNDSLLATSESRP